MRCTLLIIFHIFFNQLSYGQNSYRITFTSNNNIRTGDEIIKLDPGYVREILTDTAVYFFPSNKKSNSKQLVYGREIKHYSTYYFSKGNRYYFGNDNDVSSNPYLLQIKGLKDSTLWISDTSITHIYKGYRCARAYAIKGPGDTNKVIYTPDIKYPPGFNGYVGLPGVILEFYNTRSNLTMKAITIEKGFFQIMLPPANLIRDEKR